MKEKTMCKPVNRKPLRRKMKCPHVVRQHTYENLMNKVCCPFDANHIVDRSYIERHIVNCASRENLFHSGNSLKSQRELDILSLQESNDSSFVAMEDWDEEYVGTYNPLESTENRAVIRCLVGASKSQKKRFKLAERERTQMLETVNANHSSSTSSPGWENSALQKCVKDIIQQIVERMRTMEIQDTDLSLLIKNLFITNPSTGPSKSRTAVDFVENILYRG